MKLRWVILALAGLATVGQSAASAQPQGKAIEDFSLFAGRRQADPPFQELVGRIRRISTDRREVLTQRPRSPQKLIPMCSLRTQRALR